MKMKNLMGVFGAAIVALGSWCALAGEYDPPEGVELVNLSTKDTGSVVAESEKYNSDTPAKNLFDGSTSTRWLARRNSDNPIAYFVFKFNDATAVNAYRIYTTYEGREPLTWIFYGSNDNATWSELDARTMSSTSNWKGSKTRYFSFANKTSYQYYKFACSAVCSSSSLLQIQEFQMFYIPTLKLGECELLRGESGFEMAAQLLVGPASQIVAVATKDGDSSSAVEFELAADVASGTTVTNKIGTLDANETYSLDVVARDSTESARKSAVCIVYAGTLAVEKICDANEGSTLPAIVRVSRASADPYELDFTYSVTSETAVAGRSYVQPSGVAAIAAGSAYVDLELVPMIDSTVQADQVVTFTLNTHAVTLADADQNCDVTIKECPYELSKRYVDCNVSGGGQRAGTDWEDAYSSVVDAVDSVNQANIPATIYVKPGTYQTTSQLKLEGAVRVIGWTGVSADVVITNKTGYIDQTTSNNNRVLYLDDAAAGVYNVTLGGGGCGVSGGSSIYIGTNGGVVSNCVVGTLSTGYYWNIGAIHMNSDDALVTHTIVKDVKKTTVDPGWNYVKWGIGIHANKGRVENCLVRNARCTSIQTSSSRNNSAGGIYAGSGVTILNCTVVDCHASQAGGILAAEGATVKNCVVADCVAWQVIGGAYVTNNVTCAGSTAAFENCATDEATLINDTCVIGTTNTFFKNYSSCDLTPKVGGPLHNAGATPTGWAKGDGRVDLAGNARFVGKAVDIGAYEQQRIPGLKFLLR